MTSAATAKMMARGLLGEVVIMEDDKLEGELLAKELSELNFAPQMCGDIKGLIEIAKSKYDCTFVLDIDMGARRNREGIAATRQLKALASQRHVLLRVLALTSHDDLCEEAASAGADAFVVKETRKRDALEIITRALQWKIDRDASTADAQQAQLAGLGYADLERQLKKNKTPTDASIRIALTSVRKSMRWPRLLENEQMILSVLEQLLAKSQETSDLDLKVLELCLAGVVMLKTDRARNQPISDWLMQVQLSSNDPILRWLEDETMEDSSDDER